MIFYLVPGSGSSATIGAGYRYLDLGKATLGASLLQQDHTKITNNSMHSNEFFPAYPFAVQC